MHRQEVCGLKWSDDNQLASGGNDNKLFVFDKMSEVRFTHERASGGGWKRLKLTFRTGLS